MWKFWVAFQSDVDKVIVIFNKLGTAETLVFRQLWFSQYMLAALSFIMNERPNQPINVIRIVNLNHNTNNFIRIYVFEQFGAHEYAW